MFKPTKFYESISAGLFLPGSVACEGDSTHTQLAAVEIEIRGKVVRTTRSRSKRILCMHA